MQGGKEQRAGSPKERGMKTGHKAKAKSEDRGLSDPAVATLLRKGKHTNSHERAGGGGGTTNQREESCE